MTTSQFLKTRVSLETKQRVHVLAELQLITESVWLKRLVMEALGHTRDAEDSSNRDRATSETARCAAVLGADRKQAMAMRVCIRLRPDDRLLLRQRSSARGMSSATYASVVLRAHLRRLAPLPREELVALKRSVAELAAIGRNLNQIARAANSGERHLGPARDDLRAILKVCEALRDNVKGLIRANINSWEMGHDEAERPAIRRSAHP